MRKMGSSLARLGAQLLLIVASVSGAALASEDMDVQVSAGVRVTENGDPIGFLLFLPGPALQPMYPPPYPGLVLTHGFGRDYGRHIDNAIAYAREGILVMTPNLAGAEQDLTIGRREVTNTADHVRWLSTRAVDPSDSLFGVLDPNRIAVGGHSAGGAVSLEAVALLQQQRTYPAALILLDAVPYTRTIRAAARLAELPVLSLRSEPSACNAAGSTEQLEEAIDFPIEAILISGATHCDPEAPTDVACEALCGGSSASAQNEYRARTLDFLHRTVKGQR